MSIYPAPQSHTATASSRQSYGFCHHRQRPVGCACPAGCRLDVVCRAKRLCLCADADADPDGPAAGDTHPGCARNACRRRHAHASGICRYPCRRHDGGCTAACRPARQQSNGAGIGHRQHCAAADRFRPWPGRACADAHANFYGRLYAERRQSPAHQPRRRCRRRPSMCRRHLCLCRPVLRRLSPHRPSPRLPSRRP